MPRFTSNRVLPLTALALIGACSDANGPNKAQVNFNVATRTAPAASIKGPIALLGTPETLTDASGNTLVISGVQLVLREIELHRAGMITDCAQTADDDCEELEVGPLLVDLPLGTAGSARTFSVDLAAGSYDRVEFELHKVSSSGDAAFLAEHPDFQDASVRASGTYNDAPFTYTGRFDAEMEFNLEPPVTVGDVAATDLTLFASLDPWFRDQTGTLLDPASANAGGANQGLVEQNIKSSLEAFEDENHDGRDDSPAHQ
jgi:hypothetical protein